MKKKEITDILNDLEGRAGRIMNISPVDEIIVRLLLLITWILIDREAE